ncbi:MAG: hypothetical protein ACU836_14960 [Gammaproteobacteria bacterium]
MHLCNENAQIWDVELAAIEARKRIATTKKTPPAPLSSAENLADAEKTVQIGLSSLPKEKRRPVWDWIQRNRPALADMLSNDANIAALKAAFDARVIIDISEDAARSLGLIR